MLWGRRGGYTGITTVIHKHKTTACVCPCTERKVVNRVSFGLTKWAPKGFFFCFVWTNKGSHAEEEEQKLKGKRLEKPWSPRESPEQQRSLSAAGRLLQYTVLREITIYYHWPSSAVWSPLSQFHFIPNGAITIVYDSLIKSPQTLQNSLPDLTVSPTWEKLCRELLGVIQRKLIKAS